MVLLYLVLIALVSCDANLSNTHSDDVLRSFREELEFYKTKMSSLEETVTRQSDEINRQTEQIDDLQKMVTDCCPCQRSREDSKRLLVGGNHAQNQIAFYAVLTHDIDKIGDHQAFHFNDIKVNQGGCYTAVDGEFQVTVPGTYVFSWTISNTPRTYMESELVINGVEYGTLFSDSGDHEDYSSVSAMVIATLNVNDRVWIQSGTAHNAHVTGNVYSMSSFSGFLIW